MRKPKVGSAWYSKTTSVARVVTAVKRGRVFFQLVSGPCAGRDAWYTLEEWHALIGNHMEAL